MSNRLLRGPRFAIGNRAPIEPFEVNRNSWQSHGLRFWMPVTFLDRTGLVFDRSEYRNNATPVTFESGNFQTHTSGQRVLNLNSGGSSDTDYLTVSANSRLDIGSNPFTMVARVNIRSLGLGSFGDFGRIIDKGGVITWRFDAGSGSFGAGAGVRILMDRSTTGTDQRKAGGTTAEIPLNTDLTLVLTHDGGLAHSGVHIYANGQEITYTAASTDGTGAFDPDTSSDIWIGERFSSGDRLFDGLLWDVRIIIGKAYSAREVEALSNPYTRYDLFKETIVPWIWPAAAGGATTFTQSVDLNIALSPLVQRTIFVGRSQAFGFASTVTTLAGQSVEVALSLITRPSLTKTVFKNLATTVSLAPSRGLTTLKSLIQKVSLQGEVARVRTLLVAVSLSVSGAISKTTFKGLTAGMSLISNTLVPVFSATFKLLVTVATELFQAERPSGFSGHGGLGGFGDKTRWSLRRSTWRRRR